MICAGPLRLYGVIVLKAMFCNRILLTLVQANRKSNRRVHGLLDNTRDHHEPSPLKYPRPAKRPSLC